MKASLIATFLLLALPGVARAELAALETREVALGMQSARLPFERFDRSLQTDARAKPARPEGRRRERRLRTLSSAKPPPHFNLVGLHWRGSGEVSFRTRTLTGRWSAWRDAEAEGDERPDRLAREGTRTWRLGSPYWTGASDRIEYRLSGNVRRLRAHFVWSPAEAAPTRTLQVAGSPAIVSRSSWNANELIKRGPPRYADRLSFAVVHHTAGGNVYSRAQSAAIVRAIQIYHVQANGWNDLGYNFLVDKYGQVFEGRAGGVDRNVIGAHAEGFNAGSVGVAVLGSYEGVPPSAAAQAALAQLIAWRLDVAHVDPLSTFNWLSGGNARFPSGVPVFMRAIVGHRDVGFTECPGSAVYSRFGPLVQTAAATGLPKLYAPRTSGKLGGKIRFTGTLSAPLPWTVTILDQTGQGVASGTGTGTSIAWTWDSSAAPAGTYSYAIESVGARPARGSLGRKTSSSTLLTAARATPTAVTPNGDGLDDVATISFSLAAPSTVTATLTDATGTVLSTLLTEARPAGPNTFVFDPRELASGTYTIVLTAAAADGRVTTASVPVSVSAVALASNFTTSGVLFSPNGDGRLDTLGFRFELSAPAPATLRVLKDGRWVATVFAGELAAGPQVVTWDGRKRIGRLLDGRYQAELTAPGFSQRLPFASDTTPPRLRLDRRRPLRLWVSEPAAVTVWVDGRRVTVRRDRPGSFAVPGRSPRRTLRAVAVDRAGNFSQQLVERRYR